MLVDGYSRTSVDAICEKAGVTKGSLYHHFKTKEDLGLAVLDRWITRSVQMLADGPHQEVKDPVKAAIVYTEHVADSASDIWGRGCFVGSLSMDIAASSDRMQEGVENIFRSFVQQHADLFSPVIEKSKLKNLPSAEELAELFLCAIEGSIVMAKAYRDIGPIQRSVLAFKRYLELLLGGPLS